MTSFLSNAVLDLCELCAIVTFVLGVLTIADLLGAVR